MSRFTKLRSSCSVSRPRASFTAELKLSILPSDIHQCI
jgi:hypothetical protein